MNSGSLASTSSRWWSSKGRRTVAERKARCHTSVLRARSLYNQTYAHAFVPGPSGRYQRSHCRFIFFRHATPSSAVITARSTTAMRLEVSCGNRRKRRANGPQTGARQYCDGDSSTIGIDRDAVTCCMPKPPSVSHSSGTRACRIPRQEIHCVLRGHSLPSIGSLGLRPGFRRRRSDEANVELLLIPANTKSCWLKLIFTFV